MHSATQIADWIVRFRAEAAAPVDPMSLQKLLFYAQAFHLARHGDALFADKFKAWVDGPVVPLVWHEYKDNPTLAILPKANGPQLQLNPALEDSICDTVTVFSRMNPFALSDATHHEDPWLNARRGYTLHERSDVPIPVNEIRTYYAGLLWDGEAALSRHELLDDLPEPRVGSFYRAGVCIRGMKRHPFYSPAWAVALGAVIPPEPVLTKDMLAPIKRRDFVSARDL